MEKNEGVMCCIRRGKFMAAGDFREERRKGKENNRSRERYSGRSGEG